MLLWLLLMMLMVTMMMAGVLQGHVGGGHLAALYTGPAIVEGVIRHAVLGPASGLAENKRI